MPFKRASKKQAKLRMALIGPSGSGKTYTALAIASHLGKNIALIDTERGSASKYADLFGFDVLELQSFSPETYIAAIGEAEKAGYDVLIIDSLSHGWSGKDGVLEFVDKVAKRSQSGNTFGAWREATPLHNRLVDGMLSANIHIIATVRAKTEYVQEKDEKGHTVIRKLGLQPVQRDGLEYEFDVVADLDADNTLIVSKTRCPRLSGYMQTKAGQETAVILAAWLGEGAPAQTPAETPAPKAPEPVAPPPPPADETPEQQRARAQTAFEQIVEQQGRTLEATVAKFCNELGYPAYADWQMSDFAKAGTRLKAAVAGRNGGAR